MGLKNKTFAEYKVNDYFACCFQQKEGNFTMQKKLSIHLLILIFLAFFAPMLFTVPRRPPATQIPAAPYLVILGVAQDGGLPHAGCQKSCCKDAWDNPSLQRHVSCIAIVDPESGERWMIDATPDFKHQLWALDQVAPVSASPGLTGILLTHGHVGHYAGLMHLGREVIGAREVPVYVMPRMHEFISRNGPWDLLLSLKNIVLQPMHDGTPVKLNNRITVVPFLVPHRDEYTETVGIRITGPERSVIFIPDIDKWEKWDKRIEEFITGVNVAYLDGTFYADGEVPGRNMAEIPHPFILETMQRLASLPVAEKNKVRFIHLNHTNPALRSGSPAVQIIEKAGFHLAQEGERFGL
jgi:pyrroloquinoline quinone biosynthesis protein B